MGTPEEKAKKRRRIKSHIAKDLGTTKYRQRVKENIKKEKAVKDLSHREFVELLNEKKE